jgi:hypothetical protein
MSDFGAKLTLFAAMSKQFNLLPRTYRAHNVDEVFNNLTGCNQHERIQKKML